MTGNVTGKQDPVEHDIGCQRADGIVGDRCVFEPELVLLRRPEHDPELLEPGLLDPEIAHEIDFRPDDAERFTADDDLGVGIPEEPADLDVIVLAGGDIGGSLDRGTGRLPSRRSARRQQTTTISLRHVCA